MEVNTVINTVIEIQGWGDFDMRYTEVIMVSEQKLDAKLFIKGYCDLRGLPGLDGLPQNMLRDINEDLIKYLKKNGFKPLNTYVVLFGD